MSDTYVIVERLNVAVVREPTDVGHITERLPMTSLGIEAAALIVELAEALECSRVFILAEIAQFNKVNAEVTALAGEGGFSEDDAFLDVAMTTLHRIDSALSRLKGKTNAG
jgi:hypothetical protein